MEQSVDILELVSTLLDTGKYKEAIDTLNKQQNAEKLKENCWDLISIIIRKIHDDTIIIKPSLHGACEKLLAIIIEKSSPEEALLELIEQIELAKNDAQFGIILTPLQNILKTLSIKLGRSLEWSLNSISTYIESIPAPNHHLEGKERLLMDSDHNVRRITRIYSMLPPFYSPFIQELSIPDNSRKKQFIAVFLINLLGEPLIFMDLDPEANAENEIKQICNTLIQDLCTIEKNMLKFLIHVETCYKENLKPKSSAKKYDDDEKSPYEHREKINMTTLSGLFYVVLSGHFAIPDTAIPQIHSTEYLVNTVMLCVVHLLNYVEYGPLVKAVSLLKVILSHLSKHTSHVMLSSSVHYDVCKGLANVAIYSSYESVRKDAVKLIGCQVNKFDYKGRCMLIKYLIDTTNHSGMIGYAITLYKNSIDEAFKDSVLPECFNGVQLMSMVKKICYLPHGEQSDLVELADQIISTLNFIRYLAIKDTVNLSGIRECFSFIDMCYLEKLRTGLNMSKAHYEEKLKEIEEKKNHSGEKVDISINIGGSVLDKIPIENKKEIIQSALNAFHLIEGLIARLAECINVNKMRGLNMDSLRTGRRFVAPLACVPVNNTQRIVRKYSQQNIEKDVKVPVVTEHEEHQYEENVKNHILMKALEFVPKSGWSVESLTAGAKAAGYPTITHGLFPNGGGDLIHYFNIKCNEQLVAQLKTWPKEDLKGSKVPTKFIENAIMTRLLMIEPYKSTWPKAMAIQTLPNNVPNCLATLLSLVDDICYHSGDRSVDFNWYIRRVGLAGIYKAGELFYLTDNSQGSNATQNFVASRIRDAQLIQTALNLNPVSAAPQTLTAAFVTAKNILGVNTLK